MKLHKAADKSAFHFGQDGADVSFSFIQAQKILLHGIPEPGEIGPGDGIAHGNQDIEAGFYQHPLVDGHISFSLRLGLVS